MPMKFKVTPQAPKEVKNQFVINLCYEHGDADGNTDEDLRIFSPTLDLELLETVLNKLEEVSKAIEDNRSYAVNIPKWILNEIRYHDGVRVADALIPLHYDMFCNDGSYFASLYFCDIVYYDSEGAQFKVEKTYESDDHASF